MGGLLVWYNGSMVLPKTFEVDGLVYETVPDEVRVAVTYLLRIRDRLGLTDETTIEGSIDECFHQNKVVRKFALEVFKVWAALYPEEHREFILDTEFDLKYERPVKEAVDAGGYTPLAYPARLDQLYHVLIPAVKTQDKRFWLPLLKEIPELRKSNYLK